MRKLFLTLIVVGCALLANAQTGKHEGKDVKQGMPDGHPECVTPHGHPGMPPQPLGDLTKEQHEQMKALDIEFRKSVLPLENKIGEAEAKLRTESTKDNPDISVLDKLIDEITAQHNAIQKAEMRHKQNIRKLLTVEQRLQFDSAPHGKQKPPMMPGMPPPPQAPPAPEK
ncbi:MAG: periplasmic heavy metal sensor [Ignavibacteriales bacterium]|nr:periplasmic heavy metal sensor [Ignavibacteriales bacterium]